MAETFFDCMKAVQDIVGRVNGIRSAPEFMTDKVPPGPWAMSFPISGTSIQEPQGVIQGLHDIGLYVVMERKDLAQALRALYPLHDRVMAAFENEPRLLDTCDTFGPITYTFSMAINSDAPTSVDLM